MHLGNFYDEFVAHAGDDRNLVLLGNKCDLVDQRMVSDRAAAAWCESHKVDGQSTTYMLSSAKDDVNVTEVFMWIAKRFVEGLKQIDEAHPPPTVDLAHKGKKGKQRGCC
eukprot:TRINITY_DN54316_c0_g1_i3.p1 TRINITY_DN54316_c0_g1~~TRINITY_DN54316_c0_g1_i3.p1  ORF type:complete len:110 (-),score=9.79 TRINITY_DN54316_c0_g1_i3:15-344(-)